MGGGHDGEGTKGPGGHRRISPAGHQQCKRGLLGWVLQKVVCSHDVYFSLCIYVLFIHKKKLKLGKTIRLVSAIKREYN